MSYHEVNTSYIGRGALPEVEMSVSTRAEDISSAPRKDMFGLRLSDYAAPVAKMSGLHNVGYDVSWSEYHTEGGGGRGRTVFGALDISPTNRLTFASAMTYRQNPSNMNEQREYNPTFALYGRNLLRAADAALDYSVHVTDLQSGESDILTEREFHTYIYPGEYFNLLNGVIVYLAYASSASTLIPNTVSPVKYAFVTDDRTGHVNTNEEFGVAYFPVDNLLISTLNARHTQTNLPNAYRTHERAKYWFESGGSIEGNVGYAWNDFSRAANVSAMYEHNWGGGMLTGKGAFCAYSHTDENANVDIDDVLNGYSPGLQFLFSLTRALSGRVRSVENSQLLRVYAHETDMSNLNFDYAMYLRLTMPPNVSLVGELRLVSALGERLRGNGGIYLHAGF